MKRKEKITKTSNYYFIKSLFVWETIIIILWSFGAGIVFAEEDTDKNLSPYFLVQGDSEVEQFPLRSTSANVNIAGVIADVSMTQIYQNEGSDAIEAIYVFPASTRAAVYGMKMTIGERTITAKIREKEKARNEYEQAKSEGKRTSLLEQHRPNVFQMNVANILPGDLVQIELRYTELLIPEDGIYEFIYPTVVGPRYSNSSENEAYPSEKWVRNPYLQENEPPPYTFDMVVNLSGSIPIQEITCSSHNVNISYDSASLANIRLDASEKNGGNRDYILRYRLSGNKIESGLLLYKGEDENFFLLMMQPPHRISSAQILPREYIFVVDVSGSMHGFPLDISKQLLKNMIQGLNPSDKFNLLLFAGGSELLSEHSLPATSENISQALYVIDQQRGNGGTELLPALNRTLKQPQDENSSRSIIITTDGYVDVEKAAFDLIRNNLGNANIFTFGIGSSVNRYLIEGMARVGMGEPFVVTNPSDANKKARKFRQYIQYPLLTHAKADFGEFEVYDVDPPGIPDLFATRPVVLFGKWRGIPKGSIQLSGYSGNQNYTANFDVSQVKPMAVNAGIRYLWARHRITLLSDYNEQFPDGKRIEEITNLGLAYNLLTDYTSFVAADEIVCYQKEELRSVTQPLPLPKGVSNKAVGGEVYYFSGGGGSDTPEPATLFLLGSGLAGLAALARKKKIFKNGKRK